MKYRNWPKITLLASWIPTALLVAYILWYMLFFRPSGQEAWGDGVTIFYLAALTYPLSLALLVVAVVLAIRRRRRLPDQQSAGPILFTVSALLLLAPFVALFAAASYGGA